MKASTLKVSGDRDLQIGRIYLTGMIAAVPVAVAAIFAAAPTAAPAQLSLDAAGQSAVLVEVAPPLSPCRFPGGETLGGACPGQNKKKPTRTGGDMGTERPKGGDMGTERPKGGDMGTERPKGGDMGGSPRV